MYKNLENQPHEIKGHEIMSVFKNNNRLYSRHGAVKKCPICNWRLFDKVTPATGMIEMKCPRCKNIISVDLDLPYSSIEI